MTASGHTASGAGQNVDAAGSPSDGASVEKICFERDGAVARVILNRPATLNAFDHDMTMAVLKELPVIARDPDVYVVTLSSRSAKAFCAGGDVRALSACAKRDMQEARRYFADEYKMNWLLECFSKPSVSFINGICMGSGAGLSCYNTHRIAGENYRWAMPETALGLFPDVGVAKVLASLKWPIGLYLGLTGRHIGQADGRWLGLATHAIRSDKFADIEAAFADCQTIDPVLDGLDEQLPNGPLQTEQSLIEDYFSAPDLAGIIERLKSPTAASRDFAESTLAKFERLSPTSLAITDRHIRAARNLDLRETLIQDYRIAVRCLEASDFHEGVRALIIDKDKAPVWKPSGLSEVSEAEIDAYFAPLGADDLDLPLRSKMQAR